MVELVNLTDQLEMPTETLPTTENASIVGMVQKLKSDHAAKYGFDISKIAEAARKSEKQNLELVVNLSTTDKM